MKEHKIYNKLFCFQYILLMKFTLNFLSKSWNWIKVPIKNLLFVWNVDWDPMWNNHRCLYIYEKFKSMMNIMQKYKIHAKYLLWYLRKLWIYIHKYHNVHTVKVLYLLETISWFCYLLKMFQLLSLLLNMFYQ